MAVARDRYKPNRHADPAISVRNLKLRFGNGPWVLDGIDLDVPAAQTIIILGESGSGKSTLLAAILGLIHPEAGRVDVLDRRVDGQHERNLYPIRREIGMVFQHGALFDSETVASNVGFSIRQDPDAGEDEFEAEVREKLAFVGLGSLRDRLPAELSGGQRKRVAIARALVGDPTIMLYDEPTTGLDPITARKILDVIRRVKEELGTTSVVVTHELHYAYSIADRVVLIREGHLHFDGTAEAFRTSEDPYIVDFRSMENPKS